MQYDHGGCLKPTGPRNRQAPTRTEPLVAGTANPARQTRWSGLLANPFFHPHYLSVEPGSRCGPPRLVLVREPDQLRVERAHQQLAFGFRLVELAEPDSHVAADDDRTSASLHDHDLRAGCVARRSGGRLRSSGATAVRCTSDSAPTDGKRACPFDNSACTY